MFFQLFKFELKYQSRQLSWWLGFLLLTAFGYFLSDRVVISGNVKVLSPQNITYAMTFLSQLAIFTTTLITANAALRDTRYDFYSFVNTKPVSQQVLFMSRFLSLYVMSLLIVLSAVAAIILPKILGDLDAEIDGTFELKNLLWPIGIIILPNLFFTCCILFFSASIFRTTMMTFLSGIAIYVFYFISAALLDSPMFTGSDPLTKDALNLASLFDPFAVSAFLEQTQFWTSEEKNTLLVNLEGSLLLNRLLWMFVSCLLLVVAVIWQQRGSANKSKPTKTDKRTKTAQRTKQPVAKLSNTYMSKLPSFNRWAALKTDVLLELRMTLRGIPFIVLMVLIAFMVIAQLVNAISMGSLVGEQYPYTSLLLPHIVKSLKIVGLFVVVFYSGEMVWRAKELNFYSVLNTMPAPPWIHFLSKMVVMVVLILIMLGVSVSAAIGYQVWQGFYASDLYLFIGLIPLYGLPLLLLSILSISAQYFVPNKYAGFIVSAALLLIFKTDVASSIGLDHNLLRFSVTGSLRYSDFNGYDFFLNNTFWFALYWSLVAIVIALVAYGVSKRAIDEPVFSAFKKMPFYLSKSGMVALQACMALAILCGSYIFYNTNVINSYVTADDVERFQVDYEKTLAGYKQKLMPQITDVYTEVAFFPSNHSVDVKGHYWLENTAEESIKKILITIPNEDQTFLFDMDRQFNANVNKALNVIEVELVKALQPEERLKLEFSTTLAKKGFKNTDTDLSLLENGSYFHSASLFPFIGYNTGYEISDESIRKKYGLANQTPVIPLSLGTKYTKHSLETDASWVNFEAIVSTQKDQTAVGTGELQKQWSWEDRNYTHYKTNYKLNNKVNHKVANFFAFSSARYQIQTQRINDVLVKAYYHPSHDKNITEMLKVATASLEYYQEQFGPYPLTELNLVEIPYRAFARAYPGTVFISENVGFKENLTSKSNINDFSNIIAHEVAHQWWGHQLTAAKTEGAMLLIESLADYSALMVMKQLYGEDYVEKMAARSTRRYLKGRSADKIGETSLHKMLGQHYLRYQKGPVIYNALRHLMGEEQLNKSLRNFFNHKAFVTTDYATSHHLIKHIKEVAGNGSSRLIDEWLMQIAVYDLNIENASMEKLPNGQYKVSATLVGKTFKFEQDKPVQEEPFTHNVPIAVYSDSETNPYVLEQINVQFVDGKKEISFLLDKKPSRIVIDPQLIFIDRNRVDNEAILHEKSV